MSVDQTKYICLVFWTTNACLCSLKNKVWRRCTCNSTSFDTMYTSDICPNVNSSQSAPRTIHALYWNLIPLCLTQLVLYLNEIHVLIENLDLLKWFFPTKGGSMFTFHIGYAGRMLPVPMQEYYITNPTRTCTYQDQYLNLHLASILHFD